MGKLSVNQKHMLKLIKKGQETPSGWAEVGKMLYPFLVEIMPEELVEHHPVGEAGQARLTKTGEDLAAAMEWLC